MIIVLATDDNFVQHCSVVINSTLSNNEDVEFYILTEGLSEENEHYLINLAEKKGGKLTIKKVPSSIVQRFPMPALASGHISIATYYRLFVSSLLPETIDRIIYMDCDIVVRGSLKELWETPLENFALGAVYQDLEWSDYNMSWERLWIPREEGYFNAGVLLMNLRYLRETHFEENAIDFINKNYKRIISHDQDVLNALLFKKTKPISPKWNYLSLFLSKQLKNKHFPEKFSQKYSELNSGSFSPTVVHFVSTPKPWKPGCKNPYKSEYYNNLDQEKWHFTEPPKTFMTWLNYDIKPVLQELLLSIGLYEIALKRKHRRIREMMN